MRVFLSTSLFLLAITCGYLFATGATYPPWQWGNADFLERVLSPFQVFSFFSGFLLLVGVLAFLLSLLCFECEGSSVANVNARRSWGCALEITFVINVLMVAGVLAVLYYLVSGDGSGAGPNEETLGTLFSTGLLEAILGTVLAIVLFFLKKARALYYSTLAVHVVEILLLGVIFIFGTTA